MAYPFVAVEEWVPRAVHETAAQARTCSWSAVLDACEPPGSHTKNYAH
jgi:hypothetical protein